MQVFSEPEAGLGCTERRGSNMSLAIGDTSQDNTYATIQHPLQPSSNRHHHRSSTPDYTTLPGNRNVRNEKEIYDFIHYSLPFHVLFHSVFFLFSLSKIQLFPLFLLFIFHLFLITTSCMTLFEIKIFYNTFV